MTSSRASLKPAIQGGLFRLSYRSSFQGEYHPLWNTGPDKMQLRFPRKTKYAPILAEWVCAHRSGIEAGHLVNLDLGARTGFVRKTARIMIDEDDGVFETDWKWGPNTFPAPLKALAQTLWIEGMVGTFSTKYHDGQITIQKVEPCLPDHSSAA